MEYADPITENVDNTPVLQYLQETDTFSSQCKLAGLIYFHYISKGNEHPSNDKLLEACDLWNEKQKVTSFMETDQHEQFSA